MSGKIGFSTVLSAIGYLTNQYFVPQFTLLLSRILEMSLVVLHM
jgi:hypothetical protein